MPEIRLRIELLQTIRKAVSNPSGTCRIQIVDQSGDMERQVYLRQGMNIIDSPAELSQGAWLICKDHAKGALQIRFNSRVIALSRYWSEKPMCT